MHTIDLIHNKNLFLGNQNFVNTPNGIKILPAGRYTITRVIEDVPLHPKWASIKQQDCELEFEISLSDFFRLQNLYSYAQY